MTLNTIAEKAKEVTIVVLRKGKEGFHMIVKGLSSLAGEALSACETKKAAQDIQAQGALYNLQRQALREMPVVTLNPRQEEALLFPEYRGQGAYIQLDPVQSEQVFQHILEQYCLDNISRRELVKTVAPLVGVANLLKPIHEAHKVVGEKVVLTALNDIHLAEGLSTLSYRNILESPTYWGNNKCLHLRYNVHAPERSAKIKDYYRRCDQFEETVCEYLENKGLCIGDISSEGVYLNITLEWVGA